MPARDPYAALRVADFRRYLTGNFVSLIGLHMTTMAVGWEVYNRTESAFALGMVGLVQVLPFLCLFLLAGHVADRFSRRRVIMTTLSIIATAVTGLAVVSMFHAPVVLMYVCLFVAAVARAFQQPAKAALVPHLVPRGTLTNAITWNSSAFQFAAVLGPALAGGLIAAFRQPAVIYLCEATFVLSFVALLSRTRFRKRAAREQELSLESVAAGAKFVWKHKTILGAAGLDMFAVLFGGAVALLPIYSKEILQVGPTGLGLMQASPALGAIAMAFVLSYGPPIEHAGRALLTAVTVFGIATIIFGLSRSFPLSVAMLLVIGAADNVSVVVRQTLIQLLTPDPMRGRVSAINGMFISISNEVGGFESGMVAAAFTPTISVVSGGLGTLLIVVAVAILFPTLRRYGRLDSTAPLPIPSPVQPGPESMEIPHA